MDSITLTFGFPLNVSLGIGDILFFKDISTGNTYKMGAVTDISGLNVTCDIDPVTPRPEAGDFIFFAKDTEINLSGVVGHYATVKMELSGSSKKELFAVNAQVIKSS